MGARTGEIVTGIGTTNVAPVTPYEAVIANTATSYPQDVYVKIPSLDQGRTLKGAVRWSPIAGLNGPIYPTEGDLAQVVRTNEGFYWLTQFVPQSYPALIIDALASVKSIFPTASGQLDVVVPNSARISILHFEYEVPSTSEVYLQPNGDSSNIINNYIVNGSTLAPDAAGTITTALSTKPGLLVNGNFGASGAVRAIGTVEIVTSNYSGRTIMKSSVEYTNSTGSSNAYLVRIWSAVTYDLSAAISSVRFKTLTGNFNGGICKAEFI